MKTEAEMLFADNPEYAVGRVTRWVFNGDLDIDDLSGDLRRRVALRLKVDQSQRDFLKRGVEESTEGQCPVYRSAMRDAGRGHQLP